MGSPLLCTGSLQTNALHAQDDCCVEHSASVLPAEHCVDGAEQRFPRRALVEGNYWLQGGECFRALVEDAFY
jgi:hypothetical protein